MVHNHQMPFPLVLGELPEEPDEQTGLAAALSARQHQGVVPVLVDLESLHLHRSSSERSLLGS